MRIYKLISSLLMALLMVSCFDDETTIADPSTLSEITIEEGSIEKQYDIYKNEKITISPVVKQSNKQKPLRYTWEMDLKAYSYEKELVFKGEKLGSYNCRLIVENEDGKAFFPFKLNVNSPYEEGITVLSADANGRPMLSFMQTPANPSEWGEFTTDELLTLNNPEEHFASNPSDILNSDATLFLVCQGGGEGGDVPTIYYLNEKTFVLENLLEVAEYPDFKPTKILMPASYANAWLPHQILSADGKMYNFSAREVAVEPSPKFAYTYSQATHFDNGFSSGYYSMVLWDTEKNALLNAYNGGNGPFYFGPGTKRHQYRNDASFDSSPIVNGTKIVTIVSIRATKEQAKKDSYELIVITKVPNGDIYRMVVGSEFWGGKPNEYYNLISIPYDLADFSTKLNDKTPCIASKTYVSMLYADGNKVRRWYYTSTKDFISDAETLLTVGSGDAVITGFEMSDDQKVTYVSFYEPNETGKNGSVWAFDTDKGTVLKKWDNICYKPVRMIYKYK